MNNVWVGTDWHLWSVNSVTDKRHQFRSISNLGRLSDAYAEDIQSDDIFIYLGDLCDPGVTDIKKLKAIVSSIPGYKVLCKGNHDTQDDTFYKEIGFDVVCEICVIHNLVFSHKPVRVPMGYLNIHGHLHTEKMSTLGYQHINAYDSNFFERPMLVDDLIDSAAFQSPEEYAGTDLKHVEEKFEKYTSVENDTYTQIVDLTDMVGLYPVDEAVELPTFKTPEELSKWMKSNVHYANFTKLKSSDGVAESKSGSCHDQVVFEYNALKNMGKKPKILFFIAYREGSNQGGMTHSLVYYSEGNKVKWFENSWSGMEGIHTYDSLSDLKADIKRIYSNMPDAKNFPELEFKSASISDFDTGMNLGEFVSGIMDETANDPLDEVLFSDITDVQYWENDDDAPKKKKVKQSPLDTDNQGVVAESVTHDTVMYHGSPKKLSTLIPNQNFNINVPGVFATPDKAFALCYAGNAWDDFSINQGYINGTLYLVEIEPGAFDSAFNRSGYIYEVDGKDFNIQINNHEYVSKKKIRPLRVEYIQNVLTALTDAGVEMYSYGTWPKNHLFKSREEYLKNRREFFGITESASMNTFPFIFLSQENMNDELYPEGKMLLRNMDDAVRELYLYQRPVGEYYVHNTEPGYYRIIMSPEFSAGYFSMDTINLTAVGKIKVNPDYSWEWIEKYDSDMNEAKGLGSRVYQLVNLDKPMTESSLYVSKSKFNGYTETIYHLDEFRKAYQRSGKTSSGIPDDIDTVSTFFEDILDNYNQIAPETLDRDKIAACKSADDLIELFYARANTFGNDLADEYTSSIEMLHHLINLKTNPANKARFDEIVPMNLSKDEFVAFINKRIDEMDNIEAFVVAALKSNLQMYGIIRREIQYLEESSTNKEHVKALKEYMNKHEDEFIHIRTKNSVCTYEYDFSAFGRGKVYVDNHIYEQSHDLVKPSRLLIRATLYDYIVYSHGIDSTGQYVINDIIIDNRVFRNVADIVTYLQKGTPKRILIMACNNNQVVYDSNDLRFANVKYPSREMIMEAAVTDTASDSTKLLKVWKSQIDSQLRNVNRVHKRVVKLISDDDFVLYPKECSLIFAKTSSKSGKLVYQEKFKVDDQNTFINTMLASIDSLIKFYERTCFVCKMMINIINDVYKGILTEAGYGWEIKPVTGLSWAPYDYRFGYQYHTQQECFNDLALCHELFYESSCDHYQGRVFSADNPNYWRFTEKNLKPAIMDRYNKSQLNEMYLNSLSAAVEDTTELHEMSPKDKQAIANKYGLRTPGEYQQDGQDKTQERVNQRREKQLKDLKKARKIKKRKAFVRKVKSHLPGAQNESAMGILSMPKVVSSPPFGVDDKVDLYVGLANKKINEYEKTAKNIPVPKRKFKKNPNKNRSVPDYYLKLWFNPDRATNLLINDAAPNQHTIWLYPDEYCTLMFVCADGVCRVYMLDSYIAGDYHQFLGSFQVDMGIGARLKAALKEDSSGVDDSESDHYEADATDRDPLWGDRNHFFKHPNAADPDIDTSIIENYKFKLINHVMFMDSINEDSGGDNSTFNKIKAFNTSLTYDFGYGLRINGIYDPDRNTTADDWDRYYQYQSPYVFNKSKVGTCWDYVGYESWYFSRNFQNVQYNTYCIIFRDGITDPSHTFLIFQLNGKYYYFESSYKKNAGIYVGQNENELIEHVISMMIEHYPSPGVNPEEVIKSGKCKVYQYNANDPRFYKIKGAEQYLSFIEKNGEEVSIQYKPNKKSDVVLVESVRIKNQKLYPVYVVLVHSGTGVSKAIKAISHSEYSHASICFDSSLDKMYSFARKDPRNPFIGGFRYESIGKGFYEQKEIPYAVYVVPCTESQVKKMKKRLNYFIQNQEKFTFDFTGLVTNYLGIVNNPAHRWFCSRFVADVLNAGAPKNNPYVAEPSLQDPDDFKDTDWAIYVDSGENLMKYDRKKVDRKTNQIIRKEMLRRMAVNESAIFDLDAFNPFIESTLNYQFAMMDEAAVDDFVRYLKSFKVKFDKEGNVIISRREVDQLDKHFRQSLRMIKAYENAGDLDSVKLELCKINYMIELINEYYLSPKAMKSKRVKTDLRKEMLDLRSVMLNAFSQHLKYVKTIDPAFNFKSYYDTSIYGKNIEIPKPVLTAIGKAIVTQL